MLLTTIAFSIFFAIAGKLLMQHTIVELTNEKHQRIEVEDKLEEHSNE